MPWQQTYDPLHNMALTTLAALAPVVILLGCLALFHIKAHYAALLGLASALIVALFVFQMPAPQAAAAAIYGAAYGLLPIGWIIVNVIFLYQLANRKGAFAILQENLTAITQDRRLQLLLVSFCFGAFFEGAAGFGTPVAITASMLIGLGFGPLQASGLSLIANTAPVPFAALGTPILALQAVTGFDLRTLSSVIAWQLLIFDIIIPFWLIWAFAGWKRMLEIWPALLVSGISFGLSQIVIATLHGPWLVTIVGSLVSIISLVVFLRYWKPKTIYRFESDSEGGKTKSQHHYSRKQTLQAWLPWVVLSVMIFLWGLPSIKSWFDSFSTIKVPVPYLHEMVMRMPPVVPEPTKEAAVFNINFLSATGTGILIAAMISARILGYSIRETVHVYAATLKQVRFSLLTIMAMLALGYVTRYSGLDASLGLTFAMTGWMYPFFGTLLGWLGVALTGSDTSSNVLFGSLQKLTASQVGVNPVLMAAANSSGGVMGKMIDAQSIVVASTATKWYGHEGDILRYVFFHSIALAFLVGLVVMAMAYIPGLAVLLPAG
ncbi:L-lactate permease [Leptolinea tardivitalis]|uniref:L-lactate permease n=1 Tax=Leptolinea tardivitalis TaxID=229920 RepID=A0A0P6WXE9_9CHLR|nr:L-lactate permease [Leptolinea tardivitalis]KPL71047.1 lactate permease [Leptolinea tardivitalis]GAP22458.1 L-lactate transport [Leptolinea tardivitalis]